MHTRLQNVGRLGDMLTILSSSPKIYANINILILEWISVKKENFFLGDKSCPIKTSRFPLIYKLYKCTHGYKMLQS